MYNIAVCDDEEPCRKQLLNMLKMAIIDDEYAIYDFDCGDTLLKSCSTQMFDVVFLDIEMPHLNGLDIATALKEQNPDILIIFISNYPNYVFQAFKVEAFRFLVKPAALNTLKEELALAMKKLRSIRAIYALPDGTQVFKVKNIIYLEVQGHTLTVHGQNIATCKGKLDDEERRLSSHQFIRCHKSYLVNPRYIREINGLSLILYNETTIPIAKRRKVDVIRRFQDFLARYSV